jgi:mono/diheme cytochrome c family protein
MKDNKIYLRNGNTALVGNQDHSTSATGAAWVSGAGLVAYAWNPAVPDHTVMDQFCFSCHNAAGAPSAFQALNGAVQADSARTRTSLNPFGDSVSNAYDQVSRISVVGVYEQFATTNSSHHAVRGAKYATKNLTAAQFTNISTVNYKFVNAGVAAPITGTKSSDTVVGSLQKIAGTMYETGKFTNYYTIGTTTPMADNSVLHCGDCHTVGQFRAADVGVAPFNNQVIGAHGSNNEYMLRNSKGTDTFTKDALVCFICHKEQYYNSDASSATAVEGYSGAPIIGGIKHAGVNSGWDCNGNILNSAGKTGMARLQLAEDEDGDDDTVAANILKITTGKYTATSGSPIFGYSCAGCHNASDKKTFGGIHGNAGNASFTTYSGGKSTNVFDATTAVSRKPYRFLPGLGNFRFNGGDNPDQWMVRTLSTSNKQGCYTLNGASASSGSSVGKANSRTSAVLSGANVSSTAIANDNGILGSWGACTDHSGSSYAGGRAVTRTILRPLTY